MSPQIDRWLSLISTHVKHTRPLYLRFKPERGITKSIFVIQRDASKWPGILKLITMERVLTRTDTSKCREWSELPLTSTTRWY